MSKRMIKSKQRMVQMGRQPLGKTARKWRIHTKAAHISLARRVQ